MKCSECVAVGQKSQIRLYGSYSTAMAVDQFYDEEGIFHIHDPNLITQNYGCSKGHTWKHSRKSPCPACVEAEKELAYRMAKGG